MFVKKVHTRFLSRLFIAVLFIECPFVSWSYQYVATDTIPLCTPNHRQDYLNGVSTYDLVLISKHILGLEPLGSPYKMIAADANLSKTITTFDIVEFRKLILGIYTEIPNNTSWRFIPKNYMFFDDTDPWKISNDPIVPKTEPPSFAIFQSSTTTADFVAIKVGDVNLSAITACTSNDCDAFQKPGGEALLSIPPKSLKANEMYTMPIKSSHFDPLIAWQMALRFDSEFLELTGPSQGDLPGLNAGNFGLEQASQGVVRALWFADPTYESPLQSGQVLFHLTFRARREVADISTLLSIDNETLESMAWHEGGEARTVRLSAESEPESRQTAIPNPLAVSCRPNPVANEASFDLVMPQAGKVRLSIYGAFGTRVYFREFSLEKDAQTLSVPEVKDWPSGVYHWELRMGKQRAKGQFVRQ
jgi:hypothetical protein